MRSAQQAVSFDTFGDYPKAIEMYLKAAELLMAVINTHPQHPRSNAHRSQCTMYLDRVELLKKMVKERPSAPPIPRRPVRPAVGRPLANAGPFAPSNDQGILVHSFRHGEKYLQLSPEGIPRVQGQGGPLCLFVMEPGGLLRLLGAGDRPPLYLCLTSNGNIIGGDATQATPWVIDCQRCQEAHTECRVAITSNSGFISVRNGGTAARLQAYHDESCVFEHKVEMQHQMVATLTLY